MKILILTRSLWDEPPRLRHQVASLLLENGHYVYFSERPFLWFQHGQSQSYPHKISNQLQLIRPWEVIHHQLRVLSIFHYINSLTARKSLQKQLRLVYKDDDNDIDLIINFNYDAFWLKKAFPKIPVYTIINDDFEALSRLPFKGHISWVIEKTCRSSDKVFAVSKPLVKRLNEWTSSELFLPWSSTTYKPPSENQNRNVLLFWGYINERLDIKALVRAAPLLQNLNIKLRFVGPIIDQHGRDLKEQLSCFPNIEWENSCTLDDLNTQDCLAAIIPYCITCPGVEAIQLSNKALQLLSLGLPLLISPMPNFHNDRFVFEYDPNMSDSIPQMALQIRENFDQLQPYIADFVSSNGPEDRLKQLLMH